MSPMMPRPDQSTTVARGAPQDDAMTAIIRAAVEHTTLAAATTAADVARVCAEARTYGFGGVCIPGRFVATAIDHRARQRADYRIVTVAGFPLGHDRPETKIAEARAAVADGADHVDLVLAHAAFAEAMRDADQRALNAIEDEVRKTVLAMTRANPAAQLKVILETGALEQPELIAEASRLCRRAGAHWIKTSTGFGPRGASAADVEIMTAAVDGALAVKAAGGIRTLADARNLLAAGAQALGCSAATDFLTPIAQRDAT